MRNNYFTLCDLARAVRADPQRLKRIMEENEDFPVTRVGLKYIIPKARFFRWYDLHKNDDALRYSFDDDLIEEARDEYIRDRLDDRINRRFRL